MKHIDLATTRQSADELLTLAEADAVVIRTASGKVFLLTEIQESADDDDFAAEVERTRQNASLMALLEERSQEQGGYTLEQVRQRLNLS